MIRRVPFRDYSDLKPDERTSSASIYEELINSGSDKNKIDQHFATEVGNGDLRLSHFCLKKVKFNKKYLV